MKPLGTQAQPGAAVRYAVREDYRRFDQKRNLIYQGEWNPAFAGLSRTDLQRAREEKLKRSLPGFTRLDWAYQMAATANSNAAGFVINVPNSGGTSWLTISWDTAKADRRIISGIFNLPGRNADSEGTFLNRRVPS